MNQEPSYDELLAPIAAAMGCATFVPRDSAQPLPVEVLRVLARDLPRMTFSLFKRKLNTHLSDQDAAALKQVLGRSTRLAPFLAEQDFVAYSQFGVGVTNYVSVPEACAKLALAAAVHTPEVAARTLAEFLRTGTFPVTFLYLLKSPRVVAPIDLDPYCQLVPAEEAGRLAERDDLSPAGHGPTSLQRYVRPENSCGLVVRTNLRPCAGADAEAWFLRDDRSAVEGTARLTGREICDVLSLVVGREFLPFAEFGRVREDIHSDTLPMVDGFLGGSSSWNTPVLLFPSADELEPGGVDTEEFVSLTTALVEGPARVRRSLRVPLSRLRMSLSRLDTTDRCLDLLLALEILVDTQAPAQFSARVAWLHQQVRGADGISRSRVGRFRGFRGRAVHGKDLESKDYPLMKTVTTVLRDCIKWVIRNQQIPDWETGVDGWEGQ